MSCSTISSLRTLCDSTYESNDFPAGTFQVQLKILVLTLGTFIPVLGGLPSPVTLLVFIIHQIIHSLKQTSC